MNYLKFIRKAITGLFIVILILKILSSVYKKFLKREEVK